MPKRAANPGITVEDRILTPKEVLAQIPLDRSTIWRLVQQGRFPKPIQLTSSRIGWRSSAIAAWLHERERRPLEARRYFKQARNPHDNNDERRTTYVVTLTPDPEEGGYAVGCPALPGCWSQGETEVEALKNITVAIREYLAAQRELGRTPPPVTVREVDVA